MIPLQTIGNSVESVENFTSLDGLQSSDGYSRSDLKRCINLAFSVVTSPSLTRNDERVSLLNKIRIYRTLVLSVLLFAAETRNLSVTDVRSLNACHKELFETDTRDPLL